MKIINRRWFAIWVGNESQTFCMRRTKRAAQDGLREVRKLFPDSKFGMMTLTQRVEVKRKYRRRKKRTAETRKGHLNGLLA